jgi:hypothetical protein
MYTANDIRVPPYCTYDPMRPKLRSILNVSHGVVWHDATRDHLQCRYSLTTQSDDLQMPESFDKHFFVEFTQPATSISNTVLRFDIVRRVVGTVAISKQSHLRFYDDIPNKNLLNKNISDKNISKNQLMKTYRAKIYRKYIKIYQKRT